MGVSPAETLQAEHLANAVKAADLMTLVSFQGVDSYQGAASVAPYNLASKAPSGAALLQQKNGSGKIPDP